MSERSVRLRHLLAVVIGALLLAAGCAADEGDAFGPTADEENTIAVAERFGPATAALSVVVEGELMLPPGLDISDVPEDILPRLDLPPNQSSGSGFLIEADGSRYVVTNFHVVMDAVDADSADLLDSAIITATFGDDTTPHELGVVGINPSFDLALLEAAVGAAPLPDVEPIPLADSDEVRVGQKAIALGNPFGLGTSLSTGTISSTGRLVQSVGMVGIPMLQTDAAINPGNSGGALLDSSGRLIGVNTALFNPEINAFAGIGFAVPSNLLAEALANLELGGVSTLTDTRPVFGAELLSVSTLPDEVRAEVGLPDAGAVITRVVSGGSASDAGLATPDFADVLGVPVPVDPNVIVAIDGEPVRDVKDVNLAITYDADFGQTVTVTVWQGGATRDVDVVLGR